MSDNEQQVSEAPSQDEKESAAIKEMREQGNRDFSDFDQVVTGAIDSDHPIFAKNAVVARALLDLPADERHVVTYALARDPKLAQELVEGDDDALAALKLSQRTEEIMDRLGLIDSMSMELFTRMSDRQREGKESRRANAPACDSPASDKLSMEEWTRRRNAEERKLDPYRARRVWRG